MKRLSNFRILVAAAAAAAPLALAHANDFTTTGQTGYFQQAAAMPKSSADLLAQQRMHVRTNALGWQMVTYDNPAGPQGPIREEFNPQATSELEAQHAIWHRFYPIGDSDTP